MVVTEIPALVDRLLAVVGQIVVVVLLVAPRTIVTKLLAQLQDVVFQLLLVVVAMPVVNGMAPTRQRVQAVILGVHGAVEEEVNATVVHSLAVLFHKHHAQSLGAVGVLVVA